MKEWIDGAERKEVNNEMGFISTIRATGAIMRLQNGQSQSESFSLADLVNLVVNLNLAASRLSKEEYSQVYGLYRKYRGDTQKRQFSYETYETAVTNMMLSFDRIAPFDDYCATPEMAQHLYKMKNRQ